MKIKNKKVLITGATGFIGSNLVRRCLEEDAQVHICTAPNADKWRIAGLSGDIDEHCVDLLDAEKLKKAVSSIKPQIIFHLAAYGVYIHESDIYRIFRNNILGTVNLMEACKSRGFELFVNTGSVYEYGIKKIALKENNILEPISYYGVSKAASTLYCQAVSKLENRPVVTLRLFTPYGYYELPPRLIPSTIVSCLYGKNPKVSSPRPVRDFIFVEDVIDAYMKTIEYSENLKLGEIINIGSGKQHSIGGVVETIIKLMSSKLCPQWGKFKDARSDSKIWQANIAKAGKLLGWAPRYNLKNGLAKTIDWFRQNKKLYKDRQLTI